MPSAVAYATVGDLVLFADALVAKRLLNAASLAAIWTRAIATGQGDGNPANREYGLGFFVGTIGANRIVNHGGTGPGIDVAFDIYPDIGYTVIVLANLDPPAAQSVRRITRDAMSRVGRRQ